MELLTENLMLLPALVVLGLFIGSLTGLFGIGGAFIATPIMSILLGDTNLAIGCSMGFTLFNGVLSGTHHFKAGNFSKWASPPVALGASLGIIFGFLLNWFLEDSLTGPGFTRFINILYFLILIPIGVLVWLRKTDKEEPDPDQQRLVHRIKIPPMKWLTEEQSVSLSLIFLIGVLIGLLKGLIGIGGGVILVPILVMFIGLSPHKAVGTSLALVITSSILGLIMFAWKGDFNIWVVAVFVVGSTLGVQIGTRLSKAVDGKKLLKLFAMLIFAFCVFLLYEIAKG